MSKITSSPVILRDFKIRPLALANQQITNQSSLKLQIATEDAKVHKPMVMSTESEGVLGTIKGGVKLSSATRQVRVSISIEDDGVTTEICNGSLSRVHLARHAREYPKDLYGFAMNNAASSTVLLVTCIASIPSSHDVTTSNQDSNPVSTFGRNSSTHNTTPSYYTLPSPPDPTSIAQMSPECFKLEQSYNRTKNIPGESRSRALDTIGYRFLILVQKVHHKAILDRAISILDEAVQCSSIFDRHRGQYLTNFSEALLTRFGRTGDLAALGGAIAASRDAVLIIEEGDSYKAQALDTYAIAATTRYEQFGDVEDLQLAIIQFKKAVECESNPKQSVRILNNLANAFMRRFERLGHIQDLEAGTLYLQKAYEFTPDDHPNKLGMLSNLGNAFEMQFNHLGNLKDLEASIHHQRTAVELTPDDHPNKSSMLSSLGSAFMTQFHRLGNLEDIEAAIYYNQIAVKLTPNGHPGKSMSLITLGDAFEMRFNRLGRIEDIEASINHHRIVVELTPDDHLDKPRRLSRLGNAFGTRFDRLGHLEDIEAAIHYNQIAVKLAPENRPAKPGYLNNLANALDKRFVRLKKVEDIESSLSHRRMAIKLASEGDSKRPAYLTSLATTLGIRCKHLDDVNGFEEAITNYRAFLTLLPEGHPDKAMTLTNLGLILYTRYERFKQKTDLEASYECSSSVASLVSVPPAHRLQEAVRWARYSLELGLSPLSAYQVAIDMLPRVAWLGIPITGQHALLEEVGRVVREAIGAAIKSGEYELAVEWAEAGRSIAWQNFLHLRSPLDDLRLAHPELAARLQSLSQQLEVVGRAGNQVDERNQGHLKSVETEAQSSTLLALDWDKTVEEIRTKPGFESFLRTKGFSQLARVAREGPVIILNGHERGCTALLLIPEDGGDILTASISFPDLRLQEDQMLHSNLMKVLATGNVRDRNEHARDNRKGYRLKERLVDSDTLEAILKTLWVKVVKPVIEALAYQPRATNLPRIWWCATGPLAFLPIHAAGIYDAEHEELGHKLSDYVVSSYIPTLSALFDDSIPDSEDIRLLAVAQANAPGASRIPNTEVEVERIKKIAVDVPFVSMTEGEATIESVLKGMKKNSWVHLACHGKQDAEEPMKSGLLLHDGKLELERLIATRLPNADFAFLSACQTATGDDKVAEESVHLAAGMLFSGYKGVIATMWSIDDSIAPQIAEDVYRYMLGDGKPDRKKAAHALHYAVKRLREEHKADILTWVPFIHIGR